MNLDVIGCRSGLPAPGEPCSSYLVSSGDTHLLVDAGSGAFPLIPPVDLDAVLVTHAHPDHLVDAALLGYARYLAGAPDIRLCTTPRAWQLLTDLQPLCAAVFDFVPMTDGARLRIGAFAVSFFRVPHGGEEAYAIGFDDDRSRLIYSGDCGPGPGLDRAARTHDVLLVEASWGVGPSGGPHHLTVQEACDIAATIGVPAVVLTHLDPAASAEEVLIAAAPFGLSVRIARPGLRIQL